MATFNPWDFWSPPHWFGSPDGRPREPRASNRDVVQRWGLIVSFCLCFASLAPPPGLFASAFGALLTAAGMASLGLAGLQRQNPFAARFTSWDEATWFLVMGLGLITWLGH
jgi:hypothetical protein